MLASDPLQTFEARKCGPSAIRIVLVGFGNPLACYFESKSFDIEPQRGRHVRHSKDGTALSDICVHERTPKNLFELVLLGHLTCPAQCGGRHWLFQKRLRSKAKFGRNQAAPRSWFEISEFDQRGDARLCQFCTLTTTARALTRKLEGSCVGRLKCWKRIVRHGSHYSAPASGSRYTGGG